MSGYPVPLSEKVMIIKSLINDGIELDIGLNMLLNSKYRTLYEFSRFSKSFRFSLSKRHSLSGAFFASRAVLFLLLKETFMKTDSSKNIDLFATRLAEIRLSELGHRFIPGIYPVYKRLRRIVWAKAMIIKREAVL